MASLSKIARKYARACHKAANHRYDDKPYHFHLQMVADAAREFIEEYDEETQEIILAACWCHDIIEDARQTYNDVKKVVGEPVAEIVYALTNEKGKTRNERANDKYYEGIRNTRYATLVKICDRIANVAHSRMKQSRLLTIYLQEYPHFKSKLYQPDEWEDAWMYLDKLLEIDSNKNWA